MGYSQELLRGVTGWFMNFAFTFTAVGFISSYSILFGSGLATGGPVVMVWGWIIGSFFTILVGCSMAEICSTYPSAGSVYHWAGQLATKEHAPFAAYICGWFNVLGNMAGDASFASGFAQIVAAAVALGSNGYNQLGVGSQVAISIAVLFVWCAFNVARIDQQGWMSNVAAVYQVTSSLIIIIVVLAIAKVRPSAEWVLAAYNNETGLDSSGGSTLYVCLIGLLTTLFTFSGYEAGGHIAEETQQARKAAPRGIVVCCATGAVMCFIYILGLLFAAPQRTFDRNIIGGANAPIVNLYSFAAGSAGGLGLTVLLVVNLFFSGSDSVTVTTRIAFAMARDDAFPGSKYLRGVFQLTKSPVKIVVFVFVADFLLLLLPLINLTAFNAIVSLTTIGFQISYAIPIFLRVTEARNTFPRGAFHLGRWSIVVGWIAALWLTFTSCLFFLPSVYPVDALNMNYTIVVVGGVLAICGVYWMLYARHTFVGPKRKDHDAVFIEELTTQSAPLVAKSIQSEEEDILSNSSEEEEDDDDYNNPENNVGVQLKQQNNTNEDESEEDQSACTHSSVEPRVALADDDNANKEDEEFEIAL